MELPTLHCIMRVPASSCRCQLHPWTCFLPSAGTAGPATLDTVHPAIRSWIHQEDLQSSALASDPKLMRPRPEAQVAQNDPLDSSSSHARSWLMNPAKLDPSAHLSGKGVRTVFGPNRPNSQAHRSHGFRHRLRKRRESRRGGCGGHGRGRWLIFGAKWDSGHDDNQSNLQS